jgi:hypothetical protein
MMSNVTAKKWENLRSSIYIEGGGFDVKNCPNPLELAAKIVKCVNYHERLVEELQITLALLDNPHEYTMTQAQNRIAIVSEAKALIAEIKQEPTQ